jgi:hypothetical protein
MLATLEIFTLVTFYNEVMPLYAGSTVLFAKVQVVSFGEKTEKGKNEQY